MKDIIKMSEKINEEVNMSIRRFLKQVGVSSQKQIEDSLTASSDNTVKVKMRLTCEDSEGRVIHHTLEGQIGTAE